MKSFRLFVTLIIGVFVLSAAKDYKPTISMVEAVNAGDKRAVAYYIKHGEDVNQKDKEGNTLLLIAADKGYTKIVESLIKAGADVNKDRNKWTPLLAAACKEYEDIIEILIDAKADVNAESNDGWTALMLVSKSGNVRIARILVEAGAKVEGNGGGNKKTPLMIASNSGRIEMIEFLIDAGADVNAASNPGGFTVLMGAVVGNHNEVIQLLIDAGADVNARSDAGHTALIFAELEGYNDIVKTLKKAGAK